MQNKTYFKVMYKVLLKDKIRMTGNVSSIKFNTDQNVNHYSNVSIDAGVVNVD